MTDIFTFVSRSFNLESREAEFHYTLTKNGKEIAFTERIMFPHEYPLQEVPAQLISRLLDNLHLILGISYWKTYAPREVVLHEIKLTKQQAEFWTTLYTYGMGEFFYTNKLDFHNYLHFPYDESYIHDYFTIGLEDKSLVGIGGGKDSIVSAELLKKAKKNITGFLVENIGQQNTNAELIEKMGIKGLTIKRQIDPQVKTLEGAYQGHIPISAIYAFLGVAAAILYNYKNIIVSNEHSSNFGNVEYLGETINHQWSKSLTFEVLFQQYIHNSLSPDINYFSLLRPLSELKVVKLFVEYPQYFKLFTSCNRNFRINPVNPIVTRWCGECPKCAFAFVMLAAFLPENEVIEIFGKNLFADEKLSNLYRELLGVKDFKPFDCVGTPDEVQVAFLMAKEKDSFLNTPVMTMFEKEVLPQINAESVMKHRLFMNSDDHRIPAAMLPVIASL